MPNSNRLSVRRNHGRWWDVDATTTRRRRFKTALDFAILATAILTLAVVFGSQPVIGL